MVVESSRERCRLCTSRRRDRRCDTDPAPRRSTWSQSPAGTPLSGHQHTPARHGQIREGRGQVLPLWECSGTPAWPPVWAP